MATSISASNDLRGQIWHDLVLHFWWCQTTFILYKKGQIWPRRLLEAEIKVATFYAYHWTNPSQNLHGVLFLGPPKMVQEGLSPLPTGCQWRMLMTTPSGYTLKPRPATSATPTWRPWRTPLTGLDWHNFQLYQEELQNFQEEVEGHHCNQGCYIK